MTIQIKDKDDLQKVMKECKFNYVDYYRIKTMANMFKAKSIKIKPSKLSI